MQHSEQEIAAALTHVRAAAANTRDALRRLTRLGISNDLSVSYSKLAAADGALGELMTIGRKTEQQEVRRGRRKTNR